MSETDPPSVRRARLMNRLHARLAALARPAGGLRVRPEPRTIGNPERGRQLCAGSFLFGGILVESAGTRLWDLPLPSERFEAEIHGFAWLDDLAALGTASARSLAQDWTRTWIRRYRRGAGPGWTPDLTGRRIIRWVANAEMLLRGQDGVQRQALYRSLGQQCRFLARRSSAASPGLARFEALTALIYAGVTLQGLDGLVPPAVKALARACAHEIDAAGGIPTRNPEELLEVFTLLTWAAALLAEDGRPPPRAFGAAIARIAPTLRALRHADGGLARFHGGGRGAEGRLDQALAQSGIRGKPTEGLAMGFARLSHGRTSVIIDAAPPPLREASANAHASTLGFELSSGRRSLVVNCGSGRTFGEKWRRAGRATPSHSTLAIEGYSSSRLGLAGLMSGQTAELLVDSPRDVRIERRETDLSSGLIAGHDGYLATHGLTHVRQIHLSTDGRGIQGEDVLATVEKADERVFDEALDQAEGWGIPFRVRFHLHPDVDPALDVAGSSVSLALKSGEVWVFRHQGPARLTLEPSVYLETGRLAPRATQQIVLSMSATEYATRVSWTLAKALETPDAVRDLERSDDMAET